MEKDGTHIDELERLARRFGLDAAIRQTTVEELQGILAGGMFPLAFIDRAVFGMTPRQRASHIIRYARMHVVIPIRLTAHSVFYHDPLPPRRTRKSLRLFRRAYESIGGYCVVCSKREQVGLV